jgi:hypothetical protein
VFEPTLLQSLVHKVFKFAYERECISQGKHLYWNVPPTARVKSAVRSAGLRRAVVPWLCAALRTRPRHPVPLERLQLDRHLRRSDASHFQLSAVLEIDQHSSLATWNLTVRQECAAQ